MPFVVRQAKSKEDLNDVMTVRYDALWQAGRPVNQLFAATKKVVDHNDVLPSTVNLVGYKESNAVATARALQYFSSEEAQNAAFDFRESAANLNGRPFLVDMLAVLKQASGHPLVLPTLLRTLFSLLVSKKATHAFVLLEESQKDLAKELGLRELHSPIDCNILQCRVTPYVLDINEHHDLMMTGIRDREIMRFQESFYRILFDTAEVVVTEGEQGSSAYIIESGEVDVLRRAEGKLIPIRTITAGNLIGEIGLITKEPRTASIVAKSPCSCIAFDRESFLDILYKHPNRMLDLFQIITRRLNATTRELASVQSQLSAKGP